MTETVDMRFPVVREGTIGADRVQTVDARELHEKLKVGRDFATWIKDRIARFEFGAHVDYVNYDAAPQNGGAAS
jgi:anti-repressor protein